jgi:hypothetical protein
METIKCLIRSWIESGYPKYYMDVDEPTMYWVLHEDGQVVYYAQSLTSSYDVGYARGPFKSARKRENIEHFVRCGNSINVKQPPF